MENRILGNFLIILSVFLGSVGQILMKYGMNRISLKKEDFTSTLIVLIKAMFHPLVFSGLFSYGISMIIWLWVLAKYELSYARPFVSLGYIVIILYSFFVFKEHISFERWIGIILTFIGVFLVAKS